MLVGGNQCHRALESIHGGQSAICWDIKHKIHFEKSFGFDCKSDQIFLIYLLYYIILKTHQGSTCACRFTGTAQPGSLPCVSLRMLCLWGYFLLYFSLPLLKGAGDMCTNYTWRQTKTASPLISHTHQKQKQTYAFALLCPPVLSGPLCV